MDLPCLPSAAWNAIKDVLHLDDNSLGAKNAAFTAARELWRFVVSTKIHATWIKRLGLMEDSTLPHEVHTAKAQNQFRRSATRFRGSTFQLDVGAYGQLVARVSRLLLTLYYATMTPSLRTLPSDRD
uniref:Uncharacterized protein n=1 Tax=Peronospora matthiolae TaxID=2874970 RepID=A0AAV1TFQ0_9STRA